MCEIERRIGIIIQRKVEEKSRGGLGRIGRDAIHGRDGSAGDCGKRNRLYSWAARVAIARVQSGLETIYRSHVFGTLSQASNRSNYPMGIPPSWPSFCLLAGCPVL
jgi:hypothetical protein